MKILTLNTWGGRAGKENLLDFIKKQSEDIDLFCFQEIWSSPYEHLEGAPAGGMIINHEDIMVHGKQEITSLLKEHECLFHPSYLGNYGLMMAVQKGIRIVDSGDVFVHKYQGYVFVGDIGHHARNMQYVTLEGQNGLITVLNFHGLWNGKGKTDSDERIQQSQNILDFINKIEGEIILCGDFNLLPETESIQMIERAGYKNLIRQYSVTSTRTSFYKKSEKFADYIFVSSEVDVQDFKVLSDEVSDHAPLLLEIA